MGIELMMMKVRHGDSVTKPDYYYCQTQLGVSIERQVRDLGVTNELSNS